MQDWVITVNSTSKKDYVVLFVLFLCIFIIYLWCAPRTVVLEDDGLFILAGYFNGIAHPPGYPLYTLLSHVATWFPTGSIAYRIHILSAFFGALGCICLWWLVGSLLQHRIYACLAALAYGFSKTFWSQAMIADVYTLNVFLVLLLAILTLRWVRVCESSNTFHLLGLMAFIYGIALSNHWPLLVLSTPMLMSFIWEKRKIFFAQLPKILPFMILGLVPYLWMVIRSQMDSVISFYGPIESWSDFLFYISRQGYIEIETSQTAGWWDKLQFIGFVCRESLQQFGVVGFVLSFTGFIRQWWLWPKTICVGLVLGYLGSSLFLVLLLDFDYDLLHQNIFRVYPLISYAVLSVWLALGVYTISIKVIKNSKLHLQKKRIETAFIIIIIAVVFIQNVASNYRANDFWAEKYALAVLGTLESHSILFTSGDLDQNPVSYLNLVEQYRPDVTLYHEKGLLYPNRLFYPGKHTNAERRNLIDKFIQKENRPIYYTYGLPHNYDVVDFGLYRKIVPYKTSNIDKAVALSDITRFFQGILNAGEPRDPWEAMHYRVLVTEYCQLSLKIMEFSEQDDSEREDIKSWIENICHTYHGKLEYIEIILNRQQPDWSLVNLLLNEAETLKAQSIFKSDFAKLDYLRGETLHRTGFVELAVKSYKRCLSIWPHPENPAFKRFKEITGREYY